MNFENTITMIKHELRADIVKKFNDYGVGAATAALILESILGEYKDAMAKQALVDLVKLGEEANQMKQELDKLKEDTEETAQETAE